MKKSIITIMVCFLFTFIVGCNSLDNQYTITFNSNGGTEVSSITQDYNTQVTKPIDPTKTGYTFEGWYSDSDLTTVYEFTTMPKENITLYAKWTISQYTITFNSNGGAEVSSITQDYNTHVTKPTDPSKTGYTFGGWYSDSDLTTVYDLTTMPKENITLYAKWLSTEGLIYTSLGFNTCSVSGYSGSYPYLLIPREYNGCLVTEIGYLAFIGETNLRSITIPNSVTIIASNAFYRATSLTSINVDVDNPQYSSKDGVLLNKNQTSIIDYPRGKTETTYTIPNSVTTIGFGAFADVTNLSRIIIPDSVTTIGGGAFYRATSLTSITIPNSVTTIGDNAFSNTEGLMEVIFGEGSQLTTIGNGAFYEATSLTSITIPNSVTTIDNRAFEGTTSLTTVIFEEGSQLTTIGPFAFKGATSLTSITIPNSVTTIGDGAFFEVPRLTSINVDVDNPQYSSKDGVLFNKNQTLIISYPANKIEAVYIIPNSVTTIGNCAFEGATSLTTVIFEEGSQLTTISNFAFYEATSISTVIFEEGSQLTTIGYGAFRGATSLTSITIPNSVTTIGNTAFYRTTSLTSINVDVDSPQYSSINGILFNKNQTIIISYPAGKEEAIYTIPNSVTTIGNCAFEGATSLTNITIPNSVTTIGNCAFEGATSLTNITIPNSVTTIGNCAFEGATSLTSITIPDSVTTIGEGTFEGATSLTSIMITATTPPSIADFGFLTSDLKIYVPSDYVSIYKTAWPDYASIIYPIQ